MPLAASAVARQAPTGQLEPQGEPEEPFADVGPVDGERMARTQG